ncbi:MAG: DUF1573 domain-containing protein [Pirellulaceae bacterium]|nr:DUF1573 domain-containing protein [Pirellulaceae bacterium]
MRSLLLSCALTASLAPQVLSQAPIQQVPNQKIPVQKPAQLVPVELRSHDFGTVARSAKTEHRFPITNIYQQPMQISSVRASCGCTTPIIEKQVLQPGETGSILARFNTGTHTGQKKATLTVSITSPVFTELQLNVQGYIRSDIVFNPVEINFGTIAEGAGKTLEADLAYAGRNDWQVLNITAAEPFLKPSIQEVSRKNGQVAYKISVELLGNAPAGNLQSQLTLQTNDNRLTKVPLAVSAIVQSNLEVSPQQLALGELKAGETVQQRFLVRGIKPFRILEIKADDMEVEFDPIEEAKAAHLINLRIKPDPAKGTGVAALTFKTDLPDDLSVSSKLTYKFATQTNSVESEKPLAVLP